MSEKRFIDYVEMPSTNFEKTRSFFEQVFQWRFQPYGDDYLAFFQNDAAVSGGFYRGEKVATSSEGAPLIVFYTDTLERVRDDVIEAGAELTKNIFPFPGGRRFEFVVPGSVEMAVWSDV